MKFVLLLAIVAEILLFNFDLLSQKAQWKASLKDASEGRCISITKDGNFLIGGHYIEEYRSMIALFRKDGSKLWEKTICDSCLEFPTIIFSREQENGRLLFVSNYPMLFILDPNSFQLDTQIYIGASSGYFEDITKILYFNKKLIITSQYNNNQGIYGLIKTHFSLTKLEIISQEIYKQTGAIYQMAIMKDSSLIECQLNSNFYSIRKLNLLNNIIWEKKFNKDKFHIHDLLVSNDQRILILGSKREMISSRNITYTILLTLSSNGDSLYQRVYFPSQPHPNAFVSFNECRRIKETIEGDFVIVGSEGMSFMGPLSQVNIFKVNQNGELIWKHLESIANLGGNEGFDFLFDKDQNIIIVGTTNITDILSEYNTFIMKLTNPLINTNSLDTSNILLYPNPCRDELTIENQNIEIIDKIEIYGIHGNYLETVIVNKTNYKLNTCNLISGIYLCKLFVAQNQFVKRFCKI